MSLRLYLAFSFVLVSFLNISAASAITCPGTLANGSSYSLDSKNKTVTVDGKTIKLDDKNQINYEDVVYTVVEEFGGCMTLRPVVTNKKNKNTCRASCEDVTEYGFQVSRWHLIDNCDSGYYCKKPEIYLQRDTNSHCPIRTPKMFYEGRCVKKETKASSKQNNNGIMVK